METETSNSKPASKSRDLACGGMNILIWIVPTIILVATVYVDRHLVEPYLVVIWPVLLTFMGVACLVNARRCGRLHCFITGPFFLLLAVLSLLFGLGIIPLGLYGWQWLANLLIIGSCVLTCVSEWLFGKYIWRT